MPMTPEEAQRRIGEIRDQQLQAVRAFTTSRTGRHPLPVATAFAAGFLPWRFGRGMSMSYRLGSTVAGMGVGFTLGLVVLSAFRGKALERRFYDLDAKMIEAQQAIALARPGLATSEAATRGRELQATQDRRVANTLKEFVTTEADKHAH